MFLAPGPIPPLDLSWFPTSHDTPDFLAMTEAALQPTDNLGLEMDALIDPAAVFGDALTGDTILADIDTVDQANGANATTVNLGGLDVGDQMRDDGSTALVAAVQLIPGEAFSPVPATTAYGTAPAAAVTAAITGVALANLSGGDPQSYQASDQFQLVVHMDTTTGHTNDYFGVHVWAVLTKDGAPQPNIELGHTDSAGVVVYHGQWTSFDVGNWTMSIYAAPATGGTVISQQYQFTVNAFGHAGTRPGLPTVTVSLQNVTRGSLNYNTAGDSWHLMVAGVPNQPVYIWATHDGDALPEAQLGSTDAAGNFTLAGAWGDSEIGDWVENYAVGRAQWPGQVVFTVRPAPPAPQTLPGL